MNKILAVIAATFIFVQPFVCNATAADLGIRTERVRFTKGATSAFIRGQLKAIRMWTIWCVQAPADDHCLAQEIEPVELPQRAAAGSKDVAMYVGDTGEDFKGVLPTDGDYTIRVYLVRAAARRDESSNYTLTITVTGKALAPIPTSKDALIPGTPFHASAKITCVPYIETFGEKKPQECEAFVIRRGFDGTGHRRDPTGELRHAPHPVCEGQARCVGLSIPGDLLPQGRPHHSHIRHR